MKQVIPTLQTSSSINPTTDLGNFIEIECCSDRFLPETYHFRYEEPKEEEWDIVANGLLRCFLKGSNAHYQRELYNR
ncbi:unnamed protein product [Ambrosiozyma monospora]|uniref:Unnamed protein product n=1 Tax=Ambrosiozyma monospora TaxID=43982 RepID=A0ACB5UDC9_AMBMO|nr:unnamed protein product [Ambrosiozyma monospora]